MERPETHKELRRFIVMVHYYRNMWVCRSELLAPLTSTTSQMSNLSVWINIKSLLIILRK
jgi:hypothetical protein